MAIWQRRVLDVPAQVTDVEFSGMEVGKTVITEVARVVYCPGCGRPGVRTRHSGDSVIIHRRNLEGGILEGCVLVPDDGIDTPAALKVFNADGSPAYEGPLPQGTGN